MENENNNDLNKYLKNLHRDLNYNYNTSSKIGIMTTPLKDIDLYSNEDIDEI